MNARHRRRSVLPHDQPAWAPAAKATWPHHRAAVLLLAAVIVVLVLGLLITGAMSVLPAALCSAAVVPGRRGSLQTGYRPSGGFHRACTPSHHQPACAEGGAHRECAPSHHQPACGGAWQTFRRSTLPGGQWTTEAIEARRSPWHSRP